MSAKRLKWPRTRLHHRCVRLSDRLFIAIIYVGPCVFVCMFLRVCVCLFYLSLCLLSVRLLSSLSPCLSARLSVPLSVPLPLCTSVCPSVCPPASLHVCLSLCTSVCPSVCLSLCLYVPLSVCPSVCMSALSEHLLLSLFTIESPISAELGPTLDPKGSLTSRTMKPPYLFIPSHPPTKLLYCFFPSPLPFSLSIHPPTPSVR
jgi:hypothetical protein